MPSTLGWIDHDERQRESMRRVLAFFREKDSRDELGLGGVRDSIADQLFPGTSTIHTRIRYMLIVPWVYQMLEDKRIAAADVAKRARKVELALIDTLLQSGPDGVIGRIARSKLKTLPSAIYWAGLSSWGILSYQGNQSDYHRAFDRIAQRRTTGRRREDIDVADEGSCTWHGGLPAAPEGFPDALSLALTPDEAEYLRDRICEKHPRSLLAFLAQEAWPVPDDGFIWEHPQLGSFRAEHRELVHHGHVFAEVMHGAVRLYNLELARQRQGEELIDFHAAGLAQWVDDINQADARARLLDLNLERLWTLARTEQHTISEATRIFVTAWFDIARQGTLQAADGELARRLIRGRERSLKRAQSRFDNRVALGQWSGAAGLRVLNYRWPTARTFLQDLAQGFAGGKA